MNAPADLGALQGLLAEKANPDTEVPKNTRYDWCMGRSVALLIWHAMQDPWLATRWYKSEDDSDSTKMLSYSGTLSEVEVKIIE